MEMFKRTAILTKVFERYGGDSRNTLFIAEDERGYVYLGIRVTSIHLVSLSTREEYTDWLFDNAFDLIKISDENFYESEWWNDRIAPASREHEFRMAIEKLLEITKDEY